MLHVKINGDKLIELAEILFVLYFYLPITKSITPSITNIIFYLGAILFSFGILLERKPSNILGIIAMLLILLLFWSNVWEPYVTFRYFIGSTVFFFGGIVLYGSRNKSISKRLFVLISIISVITAITTIIGLNIYPTAARDLARIANEFTGIYRRLNIAGYSQIYGMVFVVPTMCIYWKHTKKIYWIVGSIVVSFSIILAQLTFAIILTFVLVAAVLFIGNKNSKMRFLLILLVFIFLIVYINLEPILNYIIKITSEYNIEVLNRRFSEIKNILIYKQVTGDASARSRLYGYSWNSFLRSPIVGQMFKNNITYIDIGRHSDLLDIIGALGLVGVSGIVLFVYKYLQFIIKINSKYMRELIVLFIGFVILMSINPVLNSSPVFVGSFLYPLMCIQETQHDIFTLDP